ncbi:transmembrane channel-like protein 8 isoform X2 [Lynx canadensis]|uniref:transmembrane channel-like protein 8 isoform X2 n=1 Tax=Lynx canadensis TaxID=61383 RepID=UPI0011B066B9|nr:transmembrane channel-like protein 8 isoform X2 [Lynx canadensis]
MLRRPAARSGRDPGEPAPEPGVEELGEQEIGRLWSSQAQVRGLPYAMVDKRFIRQLREPPGVKTSRWQRWRRRGQTAGRRLGEAARRLVRGFGLWEDALYEIGGLFGTGIQSYFTFLRFLLLLNLLTVLLTAGFVLLPLVWLRPPDTGPSLNFTLQCPGGLQPQTGVPRFHNQLWNVLTGRAFNTTYLFYGAYRAGPESSSAYSIRLAYLLSPLACLFLCFCGTLRRMVKELPQRLFLGQDYRSPVSVKVFSSWDFCIRGQEAATIKKHEISNEFKVELEEGRRFLLMQQQTRTQRACHLLTYLRVNVLIGLLVVGAISAIFWATKYSQDNKEESLFVLLQYLPPGVIALVNFVGPLLFVFLIQLENYPPNTEVNLTLIWTRISPWTPSPSLSPPQTPAQHFRLPLHPPAWLCRLSLLLPLCRSCLEPIQLSSKADCGLKLYFWNRCVVLKLASLGMFSFSLGQTVLCLGRNKTSCESFGYNACDYQCWENAVGEELYKLSIFNFLLTVAFAFFVSLPRRLLVERFSGSFWVWLDREEFLVPKNVLDIVAGQTITWMGLFYCPLLPLLNSVFIFLTFYIKKLVLILGLLLAVVPLGYVVSSIHSSWDCGLFANYAAPWQVVPELMALRLPPSGQRALRYLGSHAFSFPVLILLSPRPMRGPSSGSGSNWCGKSRKSGTWWRTCRGCCRNRAPATLWGPRPFTPELRARDPSALDSRAPAPRAPGPPGPDLASRIPLGSSVTRAPRVDSAFPAAQSCSIDPCLGPGASPGLDPPPPPESPWPQAPAPSPCRTTLPLSVGPPAGRRRAPGQQEENMVTCISIFSPVL